MLVHQAGNFLYARETSMTSHTRWHKMTVNANQGELDEWLTGLRYYDRNTETRSSQNEDNYKAYIGMLYSTLQTLFAPNTDKRLNISSTISKHGKDTLQLLEH